MLDEVLQSIALTTEHHGQGNWRGQLSLQNFCDLHVPSKISIIVRGDERSHPVTRPSSHCQQQSRSENPLGFVFMPAGTAQLVNGVVLGSLTHLKGPGSIFYERQGKFQRCPRWLEQRAEV